jgi:cell division septation protein DedD
MLSSMAGVLIAPSPAGAAGEVTVWVHATYFEAPDGSTAPATVHALPNQEIVFRLVNPSDRHHTVTIEPADCAGRPASLCDKTFDDPRLDPNNPTVKWRWSEGEYRFYDRYASGAGRPPMTGRFIISSSKPTVPPSTTTSSTVPPTTPTTAAPVTTTTTAPTTSTTAPTSVRPFLVPDPAPTTSTTVAANRSAPPTTAPAPNKDSKGKEKGKTKAASTETPTTAAPAPPEAPPLDFIFDPASLTPGPTLMPENPGPDSADEAAIDASAAASLLDPQKSDDGGDRLMLIALGALAVVMLVGGGWAWFNRASRYDPA